MNVVLIGYRGTGKSTVGRIVAARLGRSVISTDAEIVRRVGQGIPEIVAQCGWEYFREIESQICREIAQRDGLVIDTGGGIVLRPENVQAFKKAGILFWLTAPVDLIAKRIGRDTQRPSLTGTKSFVEEIEEVLHERSPKYEAAADHIITTGGRTVVQVADEILARL